MKWKEFFKLNDKYKILSFIVLCFFFMKRYFDLGFHETDIVWIKFGHPVVVILVAYLMSCAAGEFIKAIMKKK